MFGWLRKYGNSVVYQIPPHEPAAVDRVSRADRIALFDQAIAWNAEAGDWAAVDWLLDQRNRVRPPVPVIPGPDYWGCVQ